MRNKLILLLTVLIFIILILTAMVLYDRLGGNAGPELMVTAPSEEPADPTGNAAPEQPAVEETEAPKNLAPDFTVTDAAGNEVRLSDFIGKPVILNFWASWCGPCKMEMPDFQAAYEEYGGEIVFMMVNLTDGYQETLESAKEFIASTEYTFPVYYDVSFEAAATYAVSAVPVTYFISVEGEAIGMGQGMLSSTAIQNGIDLILPQE